MKSAIQIQHQISGSHRRDYQDYSILECVTGFSLKVEEGSSSIMSIICMLVYFTTLLVCEIKYIVNSRIFRTTTYWLSSARKLQSCYCIDCNGGHLRYIMLKKISYLNYMHYPSYSLSCVPDSPSKSPTAAQGSNARSPPPPFVSCCCSVTC
jgi:hypothetical protein